MSGTHPKPPFAPCPRELRQELTIAEAEAREHVHDPLGAVRDTPFGFLHGARITFTQLRQADDRLWRFKSQRQERRIKVCREGYAWVGPNGPWTTWIAAEWPGTPNV
jgi:hypothetical protein